MMAEVRCECSLPACYLHRNGPCTRPFEHLWPVVVVNDITKKKHIEWICESCHSELLRRGGVEMR